MVLWPSGVEAVDEDCAIRTQGRMTMFVSVATSRGLNVLNGAAHTRSFADALCRSVTSIIKDTVAPRPQSFFSFLVLS